MQASGFELQPLPTACPQRLTAALELIGARWSLLIVNALSTGPARFSELRRKLPGLSANVLTQRLHELEKSELLRRIVLPQPASCRVFELTPRGYCPRSRAAGDQLVAADFSRPFGGKRSKVQKPCVGAARSMTARVEAARSPFSSNIQERLERSCP